MARRKAPRGYDMNGKPRKKPGPKKGTRRSGSKMGGKTVHVHIH
jgi:hypothetical protein